MSTYKDLWTERCARRLVELYPLLRPRNAALVAEELWKGDRGHITPEEWAEIEVASWNWNRHQVVRQALPLGR